MNDDHAGRYYELYTDILRLRESYLIAINSGKNPVEFAGYIAQFHIKTIKSIARTHPNTISIYFGCSHDIGDALKHGLYDVRYEIGKADETGNVIFIFTLNCDNKNYTIKRFF